MAENHTIPAHTSYSKDRTMTEVGQPATDRLAEVLEAYDETYCGGMGAATAHLDRRRLFEAGYMIAVSNLVSLHGDDVMAADVLRELGARESVLKHMNFDDSDTKRLRRVFREISRRDR